MSTELIICAFNDLSLSSITNSFIRILFNTTEEQLKNSAHDIFLEIIQWHTLVSQQLFLPCIITLPSSLECCLKQYQTLTRGKIKHLCSPVQKVCCCARKKKFNLTWHYFFKKKNFTRVIFHCALFCSTIILLANLDHRLTT